jgi:Gpi18-like mannosyltransferase
MIHGAGGQKSYASEEIWARVRHLSIRTPLKIVVVAAILSRLFVFAVAVAANHIFGVNPTCNSFGCWSIHLPFFNLFSRWDSGFYGDIARTGYNKVIDRNWEFFPLYPILVAIFGRLLAATGLLQLDLAVHVAGFIISNVAFVVAVYFLYRLSERVLGNTRMACDSAILVAIYHAGVFLSATYSE